MTSHDRRFSPLARVLRRARFVLFGNRLGLGQPVPAGALDHEYASGAWDHFFDAEELPRYRAVLELAGLFPGRPRLLDIGCGSGRLAALLAPDRVSDYLGVDISEEGLRRARALGLRAPLHRFERRDFEDWRPEPAAFDLVVFNECLGYSADPLRTARRFAASLAPGGALLVSLYRSGNHAAFWRRLGSAFDLPDFRVVTNSRGQTWDIRLLRPRPEAR